MKRLDAALLSLAVGLTAFTIWLFAADDSREYAPASNLRRPAVKVVSPPPSQTRPPAR